jgi:hypothetical protein
MIFLINLKIIYGEDAVYEDGVDFIKKNKTYLKVLLEVYLKLLLQK